MEEPILNSHNKAEYEPAHSSDFDPNTQFASYGLFSTADAQRLDRIKDALFKCFGTLSVAGACAQMNKAKQLGEQCPFSEASLNKLFGSRK